MDFRKPADMRWPIRAPGNPGPCSEEPQGEVYSFRVELKLFVQNCWNRLESHAPRHLKNEMTHSCNLVSIYIYIIILFPSEFHYDQLISMINHPCLLYSILIIVIALQFCLNLHFHAPCSSFGRWKISTCLGEHQVSIKSCTSITHIQIYFFLLK
jgi:hypothetical protein